MGRKPLTLEQKKRAAFMKRQHRLANKEKYRAATKRWMDKNRTVFLEKQRNKRKADPDWRFKSALQRTLRAGAPPCNATVAQLKEAFKGTCTICGVPESECKTPLHMDHDHKTGQFRGWLCSKCNQGLGLFSDSIECLQLAIKYLSVSKG